MIVPEPWVAEPGRDVTRRFYHRRWLHGELPLSREKRNSWKAAGSGGLESGERRRSGVFPHHGNRFGTL